MKKLIVILLCKAVVATLLILFSGIALAPDEAQYWTWSQHLDFGYYSKPPGIAWQIYLTTLFLGKTSLGVRFGAVILSFFLGIVAFYLGKNSGLKEKESFWGAIVVALSPLGMYLGVAATTDAGAILGISLAMTLLAKALFTKKVPNYLTMGLSIAFGALYKWTAFIFLPFTLVMVMIYPFLRSYKIFLLFLFSLLALLPSLYWNIFHEFATFKHVFATVAYKKKQTGNFFPFLLSQIALLSPLYFYFFIRALFAKKENKALFSNALFASGFLCILCLSFFKKMQPNWALFFYPPGLVLVGWYCLRKMQRGVSWLYGSTLLSLAIGISALLIPFIQKHHLFYIPYSWNPWRQSMGWENIPLALKDFGYDPKKDFLFTDTYQMASLLSFYAEGETYFLNLQKNRKNQFSYFKSMSEKKGNDAYFAISQNVQKEALNWYVDHYLEKLFPYCDHVEYVGATSLFSPSGVAEKHLIVFKCHSYNGKVPQDPEKY